MSVRHPMRHIFMSVDQTINGIIMHHNVLLNDNKSIPQTVFTNNNKMRTVRLLKTNSIAISSGPCIHSGTKFKVLIAYFIEINQRSDSFPLFTIIKTNKSKHSSVHFYCIYFSATRRLDIE